MSWWLIIPLIGCFLAILNHKSAEKYREQMYNELLIRTPQADPDMAMTFASVAIGVSIVIYILVWPLSMGVSWLKFAWRWIRK